MQSPDKKKNVFFLKLKWNQFSVLFLFSLSSLCTYPAVPECCRPTSPRRAVEKREILPAPSSVVHPIHRFTHPNMSKPFATSLYPIHIYISRNLFLIYSPLRLLSKLYLFWLLVFFETHKKKEKEFSTPFSYFPFPFEPLGKCSFICKFPSFIN